MIDRREFLQLLNCALWYPLVRNIKFPEGDKMANYVGNGINSWSGIVPITAINDPLLGQYSYNNPTTTGGEQDVFRGKNGKLYHLANNRDNPDGKYLYVRESSDDGVTFTTPWALVGAPRWNGICSVQMGNRIRVIGGLKNAPHTITWIETTDYFQTISRQGSYGVAGGINASPIILKSGTILIPFHYEDVPLYANVGFIRHSYQDSQYYAGKKFTVHTGISFPSGSISEPAMIEANNGLIEFIMRHESQDAVNIVAPWVRSYVRSDGRLYDKTVRELTNIETPTRNGGNPPYLVKQPDGNVNLVFSPGGGENYSKIWRSKNLVSWSVLSYSNGNPFLVYGDEVGVNDAKRYMGIAPRLDGKSLFFSRAEPDEAPAVNACGQCILHLPPYNVAVFNPGNYTIPITVSALKKTTIELSMNIVAAVAGADNDIAIRKNDGTLMFRWVIGGAGTNLDLFMDSGSGFQQGRGFYLSPTYAEKTLKVIFDPLTLTMDLWVNDEFYLSKAVKPGFTGLPQKLHVNINDGGSVWRLREQKIYA